MSPSSPVERELGTVDRILDNTPPIVNQGHHLGWRDAFQSYFKVGFPLYRTLFITELGHVASLRYHEACISVMCKMELVSVLVISSVCDKIQDQKPIVGEKDVFLS